MQELLEECVGKYIRDMEHLGNVMWNSQGWVEIRSKGHVCRELKLVLSITYLHNVYGVTQYSL